MRKIPTLFKRDPENRSMVLDELAVELPADALATVKWDGACVMFDGTDWWKRREVKPGKPIPADFEEVHHDPVTGKRQGWVPISATARADCWFRIAIAEHYTSLRAVRVLDAVAGTYEAVGPHFQGNPHGFDYDRLRRHGAAPVWFTTTDYEELARILDMSTDVEGFVWWDGTEPVAKLKRRDFGFEWPVVLDGD